MLFRSEGGEELRAREVARARGGLPGGARDDGEAGLDGVEGLEERARGGPVVVPRRLPWGMSRGRDAVSGYCSRSPDVADAARPAAVARRGRE